MKDREFSSVVDFPIYTNDYKKGKQPDRRGKIEISEALLREMVIVKKRGETPILEVAVWNNTSKNGKVEYLYCKLSMNEWEMNKAKEEETTADKPEDDNDPFDDDDPFDV